MSRTITVELDDDALASLEYCAAERAANDEAEAIRQAIEAYRTAITVANYRAKEARIAAQPDREIDPDRPETPEEAAVLDRIFGSRKGTSAA